MRFFSRGAAARCLQIPAAARSPTGHQLEGSTTVRQGRGGLRGRLLVELLGGVSEKARPGIPAVCCLKGACGMWNKSSELCRPANPPNPPPPSPSAPPSYWPGFRAGGQRQWRRQFHMEARNRGTSCLSAAARLTPPALIRRQGVKPTGPRSQSSQLTSCGFPQPAHCRFFPFTCCSGELGGSVAVRLQGRLSFT